MKIHYWMRKILKELSRFVSNAHSLGHCETNTIVAAECKPKAKRRRACKDCTCGLAQKLEAEDNAKRANADKALNTLKLQAEDLAEVDFTVQGKVGSCGNCSLGGMSSSNVKGQPVDLTTECRRFQMRWLPIHRTASLQARGGSAPA